MKKKSIRHYCETRLYWPPLVPLQAARVTEAANIWTQLNILKNEPCTITWVTGQFRVQRQVVGLEKQVH